MSEKKESVPEPAGLSKRKRPGVNSEYYVPDYVMRDFGEPDEGSTSSARVLDQSSSAGLFL